MRKTVQGATALALTVAATLLLAAPASAASLPKGSYACSNSSGFALGVVHIKKKNEYNINGGKNYAYRYSKGTKIVTFVKGDYKSFFGAFTPKGKVIDIYDKRSGDYLWSCY